MEAFSSIVDRLSSFIWAFPEELPWLVVLLLGTGLFVTVRLSFIQLRKVGHAIRVVAGKYDNPGDHGDISHFQALSTALSATVGVGNIAGVATAIHYGGPGAIFWMWVTAFFGMALKYSECTLAVHYRVFDEEGYAAGGPMYSIERGLGPGWKPLAVIFAGAAAICSFATGNMNQANTVAVSAFSEFGADPRLVGAIVAIFVGAVILGGIRRIAAVSSALAPSMALLYVATALVILLLNAEKVPGAFALIVSSAFKPGGESRRLGRGDRECDPFVGGQAGVVLQRSRPGIRTDRPRRGSHRRTCSRGGRRHARAPDRHPDHLLDDRFGHHLHRRLG